MDTNKLTTEHTAPKAETIIMKYELKNCNHSTTDRADQLELTFNTEYQNADSVVVST